VRTEPKSSGGLGLGRIPISPPAWGALALGLLVALIPYPGTAQRLPPMKGFKASANFDPPDQTRIRSLLSAAKAQPLPNGHQYLLTDVTLQSFLKTGDAEYVIKAPECLYDNEGKSASSAGPLRLQTADGKFSIEGEGFRWLQGNSCLVISNRVHTVVEAGAIESRPELRRESGDRSDTGMIEIASDRFEYAGGPGTGVYQGNVRVAGTNQNLALWSKTLTVKLPMSGRQLQEVIASQDVSAHYGEVDATGQKAVYSTATGLLRMLGEPAWRTVQREGRADQLLIDRTNRIFRAEGNAWLRMASQGLGFSELLPGSKPQAKPTGPGTNQFLDILCGTYEVRTNLAVFQDDVRLTEQIAGQARGKMECELLTATFAGSNQLQRLVAERNVVIRDGTNWLRGGQAVYTGTNGLLELVQKPAWGSGAREGKGEKLRVDTRADEMHVSGNALMRLPADELAQSATLGQGPAPKARPAAATNQVAEIFSEEYTLRPHNARFRGGVYVSHPRMYWACEDLTAEMSGAGGQVEKIFAEEGVVFDLIDADGEKTHGKGDQAVYTYKVAGAVTNDLVELTGSPAMLESANGTNQNRIIILDRAHHQLITPGDYRLYGTTKTNVPVLPSNRLGRQ